MTNKSRGHRAEPRERTIPINLTEDEIDVLGRVAHYYERSMGVMRFIIRVASTRETKRKYRFIQEESDWLERFVDAKRKQLQTEGNDVLNVEFTPRALIAFWGRLLSSVNTPRSRRKLRGKELLARQELSDKLADRALDMTRGDPMGTSREITTRRLREAQWMQAYLAGRGVNLSTFEHL